MPVLLSLSRDQREAVAKAISKAKAQNSFPMYRDGYQLDANNIDSFETIVSDFRNKKMSFKTQTIDSIELSYNLQETLSKIGRLRVQFPELTVKKETEEANAVEENTDEEYADEGNNYSFEDETPAES